MRRSVIFFVLFEIVALLVSGQTVIDSGEAIFVIAVHGGRGVAFSGNGKSQSNMGVAVGYFDNQGRLGILPSR